MTNAIIAFDQPNLDTTRDYTSDVQLFIRYLNEAITSQKEITVYVPVIDHINYKAFMDATLAVKAERPDEVTVFAFIPYKEMFAHMSDTMFSSCMNVYNNCDDQHLYDFSRDGEKLENDGEIQRTAREESVKYADFVMTYNKTQQDSMMIYANKVDA